MVHLGSNGSGAETAGYPAPESARGGRLTERAFVGDAGCMTQEYRSLEHVLGCLELEKGNRLGQELVGSVFSAIYFRQQGNLNRGYRRVNVKAQ